MKTANFDLSDVQKVYGGTEGRLWELVMGEQIHIGGMNSSWDLARKAGVGAGMHGVDLCCCTGAGMRFLVRMSKVDGMIGVDATPRMVELGRQRCGEEGLADKISFVQADACATGLPDGKADFVWGEDAWCYVKDKSRLVHEAARLVRPGGVIAFTDWVEGPGLKDDEAKRLLTFMKFPNILNMAEYKQLLNENGCEITFMEDTRRFANYMELYLNMLKMQLSYDTLKIIGYDMNLLKSMAAEMVFMREMAFAGKIGQALFVAKKKG